MKKVVFLILMLFAVMQVGAQCPSPTFQWKSNKNAFIIDGRQFTSDTVLIRWQVGNTTTFASVEGKLHAMSTAFCPNPNNCTYGIYFIKAILPSQTGYGLVDGGQVQVAIKCNGSYTFSTVENVGTLK